LITRFLRRQHLTTTAATMGKGDTEVVDMEEGGLVQTTEATAT
jgi:hypothetical protein